MHHARVHRERLFDLQVELHLNKVFPEVRPLIDVKAVTHFRQMLTGYVLVSNKKKLIANHNLVQWSPLKTSFRGQEK